MRKLWRKMFGEFRQGSKRVVLTQMAMAIQRKSHHPASISMTREAWEKPSQAGLITAKKNSKTTTIISPGLHSGRIQAKTAAVIPVKMQRSSSAAKTNRHFGFAAQSVKKSMSSYPGHRLQV